MTTERSTDLASAVIGFAIGSRSPSGHTPADVNVLAAALWNAPLDR